MARNTKVAADHNAPPVTQILAKFVATHPSRGWSDAVEHEAHRTFLNWVGCAVGAARARIGRGGARRGADAAAGAAGDACWAAPTRSTWRARRWSTASRRTRSTSTTRTSRRSSIPPGRSPRRCWRSPRSRAPAAAQVIDALVLGIDVSCRMGNCMYPEHYDRGWHITGSTGTLGAAAGCARLLRLDEAKTAMALGIAASQPIGMREQFGTMTKPFHPGRRGARGPHARRCSRSTASPRARRRSRRRAAIAQIVSTKYDWNEITDELGKRFEISFNTYKPFACGIVIHPTIDAATQLRAQGREGRGRRARRAQGALAGARADRQEGAAGRAAGQVQRLPRLRRGAHLRPGGRARVRRRRSCDRDDVVALRRKVVATVDDVDRRGLGGRDRHPARTAARCTCSSSTRSVRSSGR